MTTTDLTVRLRRPHEKQALFVFSDARRIMVRAGRRGGKTTGAAMKAAYQFMRGVMPFLDGSAAVKTGRVLYATPTANQLDAFWTEIKRELTEPLEAGIFRKNESEHFIELEGCPQRIRAKTAWNADTLRGDWGDIIILDEFQLMSEDIWQVVLPMLLDTGGQLILIYTPPSLHSRRTTVTKARDPQHAGKVFKRWSEDETGRYETHHFTSYDNQGNLDDEALEEIRMEMTVESYRREILAEDLNEVPGALWTRAMLDNSRISTSDVPDLTRIVVGIDPSGGADEIGIVVGGKDADGNGYVLADCSLIGSPEKWAGTAIDAYLDWDADRILGEKNFGGDMVASTIRMVARNREMTVSYKDVTASRGKAVRAEPVAALYEQRRVFHVGEFPLLEDEMCVWTPDSGFSPNRMDAMVWAFTELLVSGVSPRVRFIEA